MILFFQEPFNLETEFPERLLDDLQTLVEYSDRCPRSDRLSASSCRSLKGRISFRTSS